MIKKQSASAAVSNPGKSIIVDPFSKKDWYDVKAPCMFNKRQIAKTLVTRTIGTKIASDGLKGRVFEVSLADLQVDEVTFRKFRLIAEEVQGRHVLTNFHGMNLTTDKLRSTVKKLTYPGRHRQGHRDGLSRYLPTAGRTHPQGEDSQEDNV